MKAAQEGRRTIRSDRKRLRLRGSMTVYLTLILCVLLMVLNALLSSAAAAADRVRILCGMDIGLYSLFGEYSRDGYDRFGLLFLDAGENLETGLSGMYQEAVRWMEPVLQENHRTLQITEGGIVGYRLLLENAYQPLIHEIMTAAEAMTLPASLQGNPEQIPWRSWMQGGESLEQEPSFLQFLETQGSPLPEEQLELAVRSCEPSEAAAERTAQHPGHAVSGLLVADSMEYRTLSRERLECYLWNVLGNYRNPAEGVRKDQIEYLIAGSSSDLENLREILRRIHRILLGKKLEARESASAAETAAGVLSAPETREQTEEERERFAFLFGLYLESWEDALALLRGETIEQLTYESCLAMFLEEKSDQEILYGIMDCIEDSLQTEHPSFRLEHCITALQLYLEVSGENGQTWNLTRSYGYD